MDSSLCSTALFTFSINCQIILYSCFYNCHSIKARQRKWQEQGSSLRLEIKLSQLSLWESVNIWNFRPLLFNVKCFPTNLFTYSEWIRHHNHKYSAVLSCACAYPSPSSTPEVTQLAPHLETGYARADSCLWDAAETPAPIITVGTFQNQTSSNVWLSNRKKMNGAWIQQWKRHAKYSLRRRQSNCMRSEGFSTIAGHILNHLSIGSDKF